MGWDAIGQFEKSFKPTLFGIAKKFDFSPFITSTDNGTYHYGDNINEFMPYLPSWRGSGSFEKYSPIVALL